MADDEEVYGSRVILLRRGLCTNGFCLCDKNPVFIKDLRAFRQLSTATEGLGMSRRAGLAMLKLNGPGTVWPERD